MIEPFFWIIWSVWMLFAVGAAVGVASYVWRGRLRERRWATRAASKPQRRVALVIAAKGYDPQLTEPFFEGVLSQDYPDYRVIFTFESADDPCLLWIRDRLGLSPEVSRWTPDEPRQLRSIELVIAGPCEPHHCGQKVHNQRVAFAGLADEDSIVAFADADTRLQPNWLTRLVMPLNAETHPVSTTYRWLIPDGEVEGWASDFASVMNASAATMGGCEWWNLTWGGSMALTREAFEEIDVTKLFEGSLNDDLRLGKQARSLGLAIAFVQTLLIPSPIRFDWAKLREFARRQYYQVRHFSPLIYSASQLVLWIYPLGLLTAVGALLFASYPLAWWPLAVVAIADQLRALSRRHVATTLFAAETHPRFRRAMLLEHLATPVWMSLHAVLSLSARFMRTITWAGITYQVVAPEKTKVIKRDPAS